MDALKDLILNQDAGLTVETALMLLMLAIAAYAGYQSLGGVIAGWSTQAAAAVERPD